MKSSTVLTTLALGVLALSSVEASAQGVQDLFARPDRPVAQEVSLASEAGPRPPQEALPAPAERTLSPSDRRLVDSNGSAEQRRQTTAMEIRQARALEAYRQRAARLEVARWSGNPTLRPTWNAMPQTASRYPSHRTLYVPAYVWD